MTTSKKTLFIDGNSLKIHEVYEVAFACKDRFQVELSSKSIEAVTSSRSFVLETLKQNKPIYGINTGFGALSHKKIAPKDLQELQLNLIYSHCTGVGKPFSKEITRAIMLSRANCLASGYSGVSLESIQMILHFLNHHITPLIPEKGSVGASGDLAPLAHLSLALIGEGEVEFQGERIQAQQAIKTTGKKPLSLGPKDGLGLINGTAVMTALGALAVVEAQNLSKIADVSTAFSLEGLRGTAGAYDLDISQLKPHPGQLKSSSNLNELLKESEILSSHKDCDKVQDPYSLRCAPQVHGACRQTLEHCGEIVQRELNSVTDNPLIFRQREKIISGGNFHGQALAFAMDYLAMGMSELGSMSERRIEKMMNPTFSDLPPFLSPQGGLHSGLMIAHVTAAALCSENKGLCHPASVDSIPTSTDKEDHVSMGVTSGRKLHQVLENVYTIFAIEFLCSSQAVEYHRPLKTSPPLEQGLKLIRKYIDPIKKDRVFAHDIHHLFHLLKRGEILSSVESTIGELQ